MNAHELHHCVCPEPAAASVSLNFTDMPEAWEIDFCKQYLGRIVCNKCGGELTEADCLSGPAICHRLQQLGLIGAPIQ